MTGTLTSFLLQEPQALLLHEYISQFHIWLRMNTYQLVLPIFWPHTISLFLVLYKDCSIWVQPKHIPNEILFGATHQLRGKGLRLTLWWIVFLPIHFFEIFKKSRKCWWWKCWRGWCFDKSFWWCTSSWTNGWMVGNRKESHIICKRKKRTHKWFLFEGNMGPR